jgi:predicted transcriptional regulator
MLNELRQLRADAFVEATALAGAGASPRIGSPIQIRAGLWRRARERVPFAAKSRAPAFRSNRSIRLWRTLTKKRWELLRAMTGQSALSIRAVARRVGRDVKAVYGDVTALLHAGILDQVEAGVVFRYDAVHVDFTLTNAA